MRKYLIIFLLLSTYSFVNAQSIERSVVSSGGSSFTNSNYAIDWTIGEMAVSTSSTGNSMLTQGFHQYYAGPSNAKDVAAVPGLKSFPNPTNNSVSFTLENKSCQALINLYDMNGKLLLSENWNTAAALSVDLSNYASGMYQFQIIIEGKINAIKISKI